MRYWSRVFPRVGDEIRTWQRHAQSIPNSLLRELALNALRAERGNLEGAAAFAAFVPNIHRSAVIGATVAFQAAYDYLDAVSEQSAAADCGGNSTASLHRALAVALDVSAPHSDYYAHTSHSDDGGYLCALVDRCRSELARLPAFPVASDGLRDTAQRIASYQDFHHGRASIGQACAQRAISQMPPGMELNWWEAAAAAGSSLTVFAAIAAMTKEPVGVSEVTAAERAYFPWAASLHTLLDCLVDRNEDADTGQFSLLDYYRSQDQAVARFEMLASRAIEHTRAMGGRGDELLLAAMTSFYIARLDGARDSLAREVRSRVMARFGRCAVYATLVIRMQRLVISAVSYLRDNNSSK